MKLPLALTAATLIAASSSLLLPAQGFGQIPGPNDPPQTRPATPSTRPATPSTRPATPSTRPPATQAPARPQSNDPFDMADRNRDGKVTRQEYMQNVRERFNSGDKNKDGFISRQEFDSQFPPQAGGDPARRKQLLDQSFSILDANKDGRVSREEQEAVAADFFKALDQNGDSSVTREEAAALRNARRPAN